MTEYPAWPKIKRDPLDLTMEITEKLDGTNGLIYITNECFADTDPIVEVDIDNLSWYVYAGSRKRWLSTGNTADNFGFAQWVKDNYQFLIEFLGTGHHYGEWCGPGIQKNPHNLPSKTFYLFSQWWHQAKDKWVESGKEWNPSLQVVPCLSRGPYSEEVITAMMDLLLHSYKENPDAGVPEGIVAYFPELNKRIKRTYKYAEGKWKENAKE